ncbi:MAG: hypothetical protein AAFR61_26120 [Bacteroidota bacterium]
MNRNLLIIGGMVGATIIAFLLINFFSGSGSSSTSTVNEENLQREILDLESTLLELELVFSENQKQEQIDRQLLEQKNDQLNYITKQVDDLEQKIRILEREGRVDKETIRRLREKLAQAKGQMVEVLKKEIDIYVYENSKLVQQIDSVSDIQVRQETTIDSLQLAINDCATGSTSERSPLVENTPPPVENLEPKFVAADVTLKVLDKRGKVDGNDRITKLGQFRIEFTFSGQGPVPTGEVPLHIVIKDHQDQVLRNSEKSQGGSFNFQGASMVSSCMIRRNYQNAPQRVSMKYDPGALSVAGFYDIEIYAQGKLIGKGRKLLRT